MGRLEVIPQKIYYGSDTDRHGARLDVYLEECDDDLDNATIYDLEPESEGKLEDLKSLARRIRFYHSKIDVGSLKSSQDYQELKNVIVIFIVPKDPLGANRMFYTIENKCKELPDLPYDDGAKTILLYTKGTEGNPEDGLRELLAYMEDSNEKNVKNETLEQIHQMMKRVKSDEEVSLEYMKIYERERMLKAQGLEQGLEQGYVKGIKEEGLEEGFQNGHEDHDNQFDVKSLQTHSWCRCKLSAFSYVQQFLFYYRLKWKHESF